MQIIIATLLRELLKRLDAETVKELTDSLLDKIETKIAKSPTKWDDATIQPIIDTIRKLAVIDDKKYGDDKT